MPSRTFPYDPDGVPSLDVRVQAWGGPQIELSGTVDSGASTTVLSTEHAEELGLERSDLRQAKDAIVADGSRVRCWTAVRPIRAQVLYPVPADKLLPWGPVFAIDPCFIEHASPLWGQSDVFATFQINFYRNTSPATFSLSY